MYGVVPERRAWPSVALAWVVCSALCACAEPEKLDATKGMVHGAGGGGTGPGGGGSLATGGNGGTGSSGGSGGGGGSRGGSSADSGTGGATSDPCASTICGGHGVCTNGPSGPACTCDEGFALPDCVVPNAEYGRRSKIAENMADPDVIRFSDDRYVLTGTGSALDFAFWESSDLLTWNQVGSYDPSVADPTYDYCFCWAPDLVLDNGTLYLYFSAHRGANGATTCPPPSGSEVTTYRAASVDGSLAFGVPELLFQGQGGAESRTQTGCPAGGCNLAIRIDPTVYAGRLYYVFFDSGNNIGSVSLSDPSDYRLHAGPVGWTLSGYEEAINEAPEVFSRDGRDYLFFSAAWYDSQYATFYVMGTGTASLTRDLTVRRLTTPVRRGNGTLIETHGHNSIATRRGEAFNFFHIGVFDAGGALLRRDTYRQRIAWNGDGTAKSQNEVLVMWNPLGGGNGYSLDLVLRDGTTIGPCIAVGRIGQSTSTTYSGVCPDANDRLVHKSEIGAFRLYASPGSSFVQVGETAYDGFSDVVNIVAN